MKKQLYLTSLLLLVFLTSQAQSWQWGKRGGSTDNLPITSGFRWEEVTALKTDSQKNIYIVSPVGQSLLNIDGNPKTNYGDSSSKTDFALSSFSCDGTYRWSKIIGGGDKSISMEFKLTAKTMCMFLVGFPVALHLIMPVLTVM